jgi:predicted DNA-binding transcriptional regulator YafY
VIRLAPTARWVIERYPVDHVSAPDRRGWVKVRVPVASEQWLVRTMMRLGPDAELVEPKEWRADVAAARRGCSPATGARRARRGCDRR